MVSNVLKKITLFFTLSEFVLFLAITFCLTKMLVRK